METAKIFSKQYPEAALQEAKELRSSERAHLALSLLSDFENSKKIMLVGHEPQISSLASLLITGSVRPVMEFRQVGIAGISCMGNLDHAFLMFFLSPKMLL